MEELTKAQRRKLKRRLNKEKRRREREQQRKQQLIKNIIYLGVVIVVIGLLAFMFYLNSLPAKDSPVLYMETKNYDFKTVRQALGEVSTTLDITNQGTKDLVINNMDTSCACTYASIIYNEIEGPRFTMAMHGTNPKNWNVTIPPGKSAKLKIYYDPNVHKDLRGNIVRSVYLFSNDPKNSKVEVRIYANQVP